MLAPRKASIWIATRNRESGAAYNACIEEAKKRGYYGRPNTKTKVKTRAK